MKLRQLLSFLLIMICALSSCDSEQKIVLSEEYYNLKNDSKNTFIIFGDISYVKDGEGVYHKFDGLKEALISLIRKV